MAQTHGLILMRNEGYLLAADTIFARHLCFLWLLRVLHPSATPLPYPLSWQGGPTAERAAHTHAHAIAGVIIAANASW
jgi:hypothetical protein